MSGLKSGLKRAVVVHSGGMDSSICLALAAKEWGSDKVASLSIDYGQRHRLELERAAQISRDWNIDHYQIAIPLGEITRNALTSRQLAIPEEGGVPTTLVVGRNGLFARLAAIQAQQLGACCIYLGVMGLENSGYRDCSREYMDLKERVLQMDLGDPSFKIHTPLVTLTKPETLEIAHQLGILNYLLEQTISCYEGIPRQGCGQCPSCQLRNSGIRTFAAKHPNVQLPYSA
jgi:7-cyano-7-deazaguanine synthase